jgi:hypothetical protein
MRYAVKTHDPEFPDSAIGRAYFYVYATRKAAERRRERLQRLLKPRITAYVERVPDDTPIKHRPI